MNGPKFSEDVRPITDLKTGASKIVRHLHLTRRPVLLTRRGRGVAVMLDLEEYERLVERARFIEAVERGAAAADAGDLHDNEKAVAILTRFGEEDD